MRKIKIGLVQINERKEGMLRSGVSKDNGDQVKDFVTIPYSVGILQAYAQQHSSNPDRFDFMLPIYKRMLVKEGVSYLLEADIVGFSAYVWNINLSLAIAEELKKQNPEIVILFGGPQVPDHAEEFLNENRFIDLVCHGEGETIFLQILENSFPHNWGNIPSISFINSEGKFHTNPKASRINDLNKIPSPYLQNTFKPLIDANPQNAWIVLWETNRGCPFSCTFCDWGSATNAKVNRFEMNRLYKELQWCGENNVEIIFCCDANFGILARDEELADFAVLVKEAFGKPRILTVQNTKNATERAYRIQHTLASAKMNPVVTLSLQSLNDDTLEAIKRKNISSEHFKELQRRFIKDRVPTYTDVILSMPGETYESYVNGICNIIYGGQHHRILFYNLSILPNAEMGDPEYQKKYEMKIVRQPIVLMHSSIEIVEEVPEYLETVVATRSMPLKEWRRAKVFWWLTEMLYFNNILKVPIITISNHFNINVRTLLEPFLDVEEGKYPVISNIIEQMYSKAAKIQNGECEFVASAEFLGIHWTIEQFLIIQLVQNDKLADFFTEVENLLKQSLRNELGAVDTCLLTESIRLSQALFRLPGTHQDTEVELELNIWDYYESLLDGSTIQLEPNSSFHLILRSRNPYSNFEEWLEHQVACQNFKDQYFYKQEILNDKKLKLKTT